MGFRCVVNILLLDESIEFNFGKVVSTSNRFKSRTITVENKEPIIFTQELDLK